MKRTTFERNTDPNFDAVFNTGVQLAALKKEGFKEESVSAGIGLAQGNKPGWQTEAEIKFAENSSNKVGYNFRDVEAFREEVVFQYLFGGKIEGLSLATVATSGGSDALSKISGIFGGPIVIAGYPNWPNTAGLFERKGGVIAPYLDLDLNTGIFDCSTPIEMISSNSSDLLDVMDGKQQKSFLQSAAGAFQKTTNFPYKHSEDFCKSWLESKMVVHLLHAVCKNPTGVDFPKDVDGFQVWEVMANRLLAKNMILVIDAAYLGFGEGSDQDNEMIRFFAAKGVKLAIAFSGSKLYNVYSNKRIGSLVLVNFDDVQKKALYEGRNTTSAIGTDGQNFAAFVENDDHISYQHKQWLEERRNNRAKNAEIIASYLFDDGLKKLFVESKGLFVSLGENFAQFLFPELAEAMGVAVSAEAMAFPKDYLRVQGIITPDSGLGDGNVRLNLMQITNDQAHEIGRTLGRVEEKIKKTNRV